MQLIEKANINHHIFVYSDQGAVRVKVVDNSGEGDFVDPSGVIDEDLFIPLVSGKVTPGSIDEVIYLLGRLPLSITVTDENDKSVVAEHKNLPDNDEDRKALLRLSWRAINEIENRLKDGEMLEDMPQWYRCWKKTVESRTMSLF